MFANGDLRSPGAPATVSEGLSAPSAKATPAAVQPDPPVPGVLLSATVPGASPISTLLQPADVQFHGGVGRGNRPSCGGFSSASNQVAAAWSSTAISSFQAATLTASNATVTNKTGKP